jgi:hypothetical protein
MDRRRRRTRYHAHWLSEFLASAKARCDMIYREKWIPTGDHHRDQEQLWKWNHFRLRLNEITTHNRSIKRRAAEGFFSRSLRRPLTFSYIWEHEWALNGWWFRFLLCSIEKLEDDSQCLSIYSQASCPWCHGSWRKPILGLPNYTPVDHAIGVIRLGSPRAEKKQTVNYGKFMYINSFDGFEWRFCVFQWKGSLAEGIRIMYTIYTGRWFGTWLLFFHSVGNVIIPTDELHHISEG